MDLNISLPNHELSTDSKVFHKGDVHSIEKFRIETSEQQKTDWGHHILSIEQTWKKHNVTGKGVTVAVLDTGVDGDHSDLTVKDGRDFTGSPFNWKDVQGHGTHCAGIIAARNNEIGVVGAAPDAAIIAGKVLGDNGSGNILNIARGIDWAVSMKADVISMSLGGDGPISYYLRTAIDRAIKAGVIVVVAAGNSGPYPGTIGSPGNYTPCVTVGAIDKNLQIARFSSRGAQIDICAPGVQILSTYPNEKYTALSGTSMATPYVSAIAALFVEKCRQLDIVPSQSMFEKYARKTARDLGTIGFDINYGEGMIMPDNILTALTADHSPPPPSKPPSPPEEEPPKEVDKPLPHRPTPPPVVRRPIRRRRRYYFRAVDERNGNSDVNCADHLELIDDGDIEEEKYEDDGDEIHAFTIKVVLKNGETKFLNDVVKAEFTS